LKYEDIRLRLIKIFTGRASADADDLADETINRVTSKLNEIQDFTGDRRRYFFGVANKVSLEYQRRKPPQPPPVPPVDSDQVELEYRCLERCIEGLSEQHRELLMAYYGAEGRAKIEQRRLLAEKCGIAPNALRLRAFRIRQSLLECVENCIERSQR
jgi:DNA-directed RNA polymerase specialized sigma24 family protein